MAKHIPNVLILDCSQELRQFRSATSEIDMPVIDIDVVLEYLFKAIDELNDYNDLEVSVYQICAIAERSEKNLHHIDDYVGNNKLYTALMSLGQDLRTKLTHEHLYLGDTFPFKFRIFINDCTIVFQQVTDVG
jgi:hypothetical protein